MPQADTQNEIAVHRHSSHDLDLTTLARPALQEIHITVRPSDGELPASMFQRLADALTESAGQVVNMNIFGLAADYAEGIEALTAACGPIDWPVTWVEGGGCDGEQVAGIQVQAVSGVAVQTMRLNDRPVARIFDDGFANYCFLGDLRPTDPTRPRAHQARETFDNLQAALQLAGMTMSNLVRTWLFIEAILEWYDELNAVRDEFFRETGVFDGMVPASTGIGGGNPFGTALIAGALAIAPRDDSVTIQPLPSPLQCPALDYGSSFSRAAEIAVPDHRRILVSGTASIGPDGETVHHGDAAAQIARTMEVVAAILTSRQMSYADVTRAIAYFKHGHDAPLLEQYCAERGLPPLPVVLCNDEVCRDDLLFEVEVDAITGA